MPRSLPDWIVVLWFGLATTTAFGQVGDVGGVHDPCIAREGKTHYVFSTHGGIHVRRSEDLKQWRHDGQVFEELPAWTREAVPGVRDLWAPDICRIDGEWRLYYSVSTFGRNRSAIGLATNRTLDRSSPDYRWDDRGVVVTSTPGRDDFNAIDPHVVLDAEGVPWLSFGSYWDGIKLCRLERKTGKRADDVLHAIASRNGGAVEAPFIHRHAGDYYLFVSFDKCCDGVRSTYNIRVGRSYRVTGPYKDREDRPMADGGGTLVLEGRGRYRGPGHNAVLQDENRTWLVHHFYDAEARGKPTLQIRSLTWDAAGWPIVGEPIVTDENLRPKPAR
ncbi:MAG: arabinan endo-1,5-alpha-L-arabinosidase [Planctomycetaceae bacterium]